MIMKFGGGRGEGVENCSPAVIRFCPFASNAQIKNKVTNTSSLAHSLTGRKGYENH